MSIEYFKKSIFFDQLFTDSYINLLDWLERINEISQANLYLNQFSNVVKKIDYKIKFFEALLLSRERKFKASENILNKYKLEKYFEKNKDLTSFLLLHGAAGAFFWAIFNRKSYLPRVTPK